MTSWPSLRRRVTIYLLAYALVVLVSSCRTPAPTYRPPPCPAMTWDQINQTAELVGTPIVVWVGEIERYCTAIDTLLPEDG